MIYRKTTLLLRNAGGRAHRPRVSSGRKNYSGSPSTLSRGNLSEPIVGGPLVRIGASVDTGDVAAYGGGGGGGHGGNVQTHFARYHVLAALPTLSIYGEADSVEVSTDLRN